MAFPFPSHGASGRVQLPGGREARRTTYGSSAEAEAGEEGGGQEERGYENGWGRGVEGRGGTGSGTRGWAARARVTCVARVFCLHPHRCSRDQLEHCVTRTQYRQRSFRVCDGKTDSVLTVGRFLPRTGKTGHYAWPPMTSSAGGGRRAAENERRAALLKTPRLLVGDCSSPRLAS